MTRHRRYIVFVWLAAAALAAGEASAPPPQLADHCISCHGPEKQKGDVDLAALTGHPPTAAALKTWRTAYEKLARHEMPPEKARQPSDEDRQKLMAWISSLKYAGPPDPGRVTIRRLNRAEYNNTIRDLVGVDIKPAADFPSDDVGEGFDDLGDVLSLPPILFEKYLEAAEKVLDKAIVDEQTNLHFEAAKLAAVVDGKPAKPDAGERVLSTPGEVRADVAIPNDGRYTLRVQAGAEQAGDEPVRIALKVDKDVVKEFKVTAARASPGSYTAIVPLERGRRVISVVFLNPSFDAKPAGGGNAGNAGIAGKPADAPKPRPGGQPGAGAPVAGGAGAGAGAGAAGPRVLHLAALDVVGPPAGPPTESHKRIFVVKPGKDLAKRDAARQVIERFAGRAFRRPASEAETERLLKLYDTAEKQGAEFTAAVRAPLSAVLVSPHFLFRVERDGKPDANGAYRISDWELASRLSYFLWSSMPDEALAEDARQDRLHLPEVLSKEVARMLKDARSRALVDNFFGQWLEFRNLDEVQPDPKYFPEFTKDLRKLMLDEVSSYCDNLVREDRSVLELIDSDYAFLNERLAKLYGIDGVTGGELRKVAITDRNRGGVLTTGAILTITSNPNRTSPVKRGKFILEQILGDPPPPPPPAVSNLPEQGTATLGLTLRQRMERHRLDPVCASCHQRMDPIGFGFENFDGIGRWRTSDNNQPLDTTGTLPDGSRFAGPVELKAIFLARKDAFARCLAEKMLVYALGRAPIAADDDATAAIARATAADGYRFSSLVQALVASYPFQNRRIAQPGGKP